MVIVENTLKPEVYFKFIFLKSVVLTIICIKNFREIILSYINKIFVFFRSSIKLCYTKNLVKIKKNILLQKYNVITYMSLQNKHIMKIFKLLLKF
jgi:hypothetical protein